MKPIHYIILAVIGLVAVFLFVRSRGTQTLQVGSGPPPATSAPNPNVPSTKPGSSGVLAKYDATMQGITNKVFGTFGVGFLSPIANKVSDYTNPTDPDFYKTTVGKAVKDTFNKLKFW